MGGGEGCYTQSTFVSSKSIPGVKNSPYIPCIMVVVVVESSNLYAADKRRFASRNDGEDRTLCPPATAICTSQFRLCIDLLH
jgi:hypothetical protein